jgi:hypothetical protein
LLTLVSKEAAHFYPFVKCFAKKILLRDSSTRIGGGWIN